MQCYVVYCQNAASNQESHVFANIHMAREYAQSMYNAGYGVTLYCMNSQMNLSIYC